MTAYAQRTPWPVCCVVEHAHGSGALAEQVCAGPFNAGRHAVDVSGRTSVGVECSEAIGR